MTEDRGGVSVTPEQLRAMQAGGYILHARDGQPREIPVHMTRLPLDPHGHVQRLSLVQAPDGTLYAAQHSLIHKSTINGITWTHLERTTPAGSWRLQFSPDGEWLLTLTGSCYGDVDSGWDCAIGRTDFAGMR